jgi:hypothetical protein
VSAARPVRGRHAQRARRAGVVQPPPVCEHRDSVVRPQPEDRGDGHGSAQVALVLAPDELASAGRRVVGGAVPVVAAQPASPAHRGARRQLPGGPRLLGVRAGEAPSGDGAVHAAVHGAALRAPDAGQEPLRRSGPQQRVHVEHAVVGGEDEPVAERAEAAAGRVRLRRAEAGAAERGGPDGVPRQPQRRQHAALVQPRRAAGGVRLQEGRRQPLRALGGGREGPGLVPAEEVVILRLLARSCREH